MCFLSYFLFCIHLHHGCLVIAISGIVASVVGIALVFYKALPEVNLEWFILALVFVTIYLLSKMLLLVGIISNSMRTVLGLLAIIYPIGLCIWQIIAKDAILKIALVTYFIIMELYDAWIVLSYWRLVTNCCAKKISI